MTMGGNMNGMLKMTILSTIRSTGAWSQGVGSKIITMITEGVYKVAWTEPTDPELHPLFQNQIDLIAGQLEHLKNENTCFLRIVPISKRILDIILF